MALAEVAPAQGASRAEILRLAGALEDASEHPVARAIARAAREELGELPVAESFVNREGLGVEGVVQGHGLQIGRPSLLREWSLDAPPELDAARRRAEEQGRTAVLVAWDGQVRGLLVVVDTVKPTSREAIAELQGLGLRPALLDRRQRGDGPRGWRRGRNRRGDRRGHAVGQGRRRQAPAGGGSGCGDGRRRRQ